MVRVGPHWDVVRAPEALGGRALALLGGATGAVIADYNLMYWLIRPGAAQCWRRIRQVQTLGTGRVETSYIGVPPIDRTSGPYLHWRVPVGPGRYLTDANRLREALVRAVVAELGVAEGDDR
ncbi:hypothetical protein ADL28_42550 [Streptomyces violaceusniger]|uniref:Uncharacterized protein n=2 Tax=Streptomyces violaceusniger group TaxID=2839105 RepID=A0ABD5JAH6_9ACTN|nr:hypothetical protein [Streptomyces violaceusniger]KUL43575.1 hypothetical protein ADL28_42550 [Streptomyces violaceusniger]MEE4584643.1 hypothetical protein [Streptomyces sp. DSM 41602]